MDKQMYLESVLPFFPKAFIYKESEIILVPKINIYFLLSNVENYFEFRCKMLEWLSRPAHKGVSKYWQSKIKTGLNGFFRKNWSNEDMSLIYTCLGNGVKRKLCCKFMLSGYDLSVLSDHLAARSVKGGE